MNKCFALLKAIFLLAAVTALAGCSLTTGALSNPTPDNQVFASTLAAARTEAVQTVVFVSTLAAAKTEAVQSVYQTLTQAAALTPSATLRPPTKTPRPTANKAKTNIAQTATKKAAATKKPTVSPTSGDYKCFITSEKPRSGDSITKGTNFDFKLTIRNDGTETWKPSTVDFVYLSGPKFQKTANVVKLTADVPPGKSVNLSVDMAANSARGTQNINWALEHGAGNFFCYAGITITIK
jgi:hypothetical protein